MQSSMGAWHYKSPKQSGGNGRGRVGGGVGPFDKIAFWGLSANF